MTHCYIYIRFSTPQQEKGDSHRRQLDDCRAHCERNGWEVVEVIEDLGRSAWKGDHLTKGNLGKFADRVRGGEILEGSILLVEALDRLSRQKARAALRWIEDMADLGLRIANIANGKVYDRESLAGSGSLMEVFEILFQAEAANKYGDQLSGRVAKAWSTKRANAATGTVVSKHVRGWLEVVGLPGDPHRHFKPIPERVSVVVRIYEMAADGIGAPTIAATLNAEGIPSFGKPKKNHDPLKPFGWENSYVTEILACPSVEGDWIPGSTQPGEKPERIVGYFGAPIVDADLVARARAMVKLRKGKGGRGSDQLSNLFVGLVTCAHCRGPMVFQQRSAAVIAKRPNGKSNSYFRCKNAFFKLCTQSKVFSYKPFEQAALNAMLPLALDEKHFRRPDHSKQRLIEIAGIEKAITVNKEAWEFAFRRMMTHESPLIAEKMTELEAEAKALTKKLSEAQGELEAARGLLTLADRINRVHEVRESLDDPDMEIRLVARRKVIEALRGVVTSVTASAVDRRGRPRLTLKMELAGGAHDITFNNDGEVIRQDTVTGLFAAMGDKEFRDRLTGGEPAREAMLTAYIRRQYPQAA